jgi:hypothetical protein
VTESDGNLLRRLPSCFRLRHYTCQLKFQSYPPGKIKLAKARFPSLKLRENFSLWLAQAIAQALLHFATAYSLFLAKSSQASLTFVVKLEQKTPLPSPLAGEKRPLQKQSISDTRILLYKIKINLSDSITIVVNPPMCGTSFLLIGYFDKTTLKIKLFLSGGSRRRRVLSADVGKNFSPSE